MSDLRLMFQVRAQHGCLVVRDTQSEDDISDWDPSSANWYRAGSSIIFGVLPGSEGWINCEVWSGDPTSPLPIIMFEEKILSEKGWLVVHDPNEDVRMKFRGETGKIVISALVDDPKFASRIQLVFRRVAE